MEIKNLIDAINYLDDGAKAKSEVEICKSIGLTMDDAEYVAGQRALRIVMMITGRPLPTKMEAIPLDIEEQRLITLLQAASTDGIFIGLAAAQGLKPGPVPDHTNN